jgi:hypothetical protein
MDKTENEKFINENEGGGNDLNLLTDDNDGGDHALSLRFTVGFNSSMTGGVHNLTQNKKKQIFYSSAHTGVVYNYETGEQTLLQGHVKYVTDLVQSNHCVMCGIR